jgi:hypothetical protein
MTKTKPPVTIRIDDIGKLHPPKTMFLRVEVGKADLPTGDSFEMTVNAGNYAPIVRSKQTGRSFTLSWSDIVSLAITKGIDLEDRQTEKQ